MKKIVLILLMLVVVVCGFAYLYIPNTIVINSAKAIPVNKEGLYRKLGDTAEWQNWWPGKKRGAETGTWDSRGFSYRLADIKTLSLPVTVSGKGFSAEAEITLLAEGPDSSVINFHSSFPSSSNPVKRIAAYFRAQKIKKTADEMLAAAGSYYRQTVHLYHYNIEKDHVVDSTLLFTYRETTSPPSVELIYSMVDELKAYIIKNHAKETGFPMLNVFTKDSIRYLVKVAIPVDRKLPDAGTISYRWMLGGGNILITEVKGGPAGIKKAYTYIEQYVEDHRRIAPAIPFESLVTDRRKEPDTSKWITRIYYPVM
ncbi:MAG: GyrI-like domain-containing protein [Chitinophagaceae bacterium]